MTANGNIARFLGGDFDDIEYLGRGSSASVFRANQRSLGRPVAVKVFRCFADDETDRVLAEARTQASLSWHANVVSLYDQGTTVDGFPYFVMEYAPGGSLEDRVRDRGALCESEWRRLGMELSAAVAAAHDAGVVHCDVKPSNVLFAADGSVRLADFGIAQVTGLLSGTLDSIEGSLAYVPPELLEGAAPQAGNDVYSLGLTLFFAAAGRSPRQGLGDSPAAVLANAMSQRISLSSECPGLPGRLTRVVDSAMSVEPSNRPSSQQLLSEFSDSLGGGVASQVHAGPSKRWRAAVAALLVAALVGTVLYVSRSPSDAAPAATADPESVDLCGALSTNVAERTAVANEVSQELVMSTAPVEVIERLLVEYPLEFGEIQHRFLQVVSASRGEGQVPVTAAQLSRLTLAEVFRDLGGGKEFLFDGRAGSLDSQRLPPDLRQPAEVVSRSYETAVERCPQVDVDLTPAKATMNGAIYRNLYDSKFMDGFFSNPRSLELLDADTVVMLLTLAEGFTKNLLDGRWSWFVDLLDQNPEIRSAVTFERPDILLNAATDNPELVERISSPAWLDDIKTGLKHASESERFGIQAMYGPVMRELGIGRL